MTSYRDGLAHARGECDSARCNACDAKYEAERVDCPECDTPTHPDDLCEHLTPACDRCCGRGHDDEDPDKFREWVGRGWVA